MAKIDFRPLDSKIDFIPKDDSETDDSKLSVAKRISSDVLAGLAESGKQNINLLAKGTNLITGMVNALTNPSVGVSGFRNIQKLPSPQMPDYNYSKLLGVKNPSLTDIAIQKITQYAPDVLGAGEGGVSLVKNFGSKMPFVGKQISKISAGKLTKQIENGLEDIKNTSNSEAFDDAVNNYEIKHVFPEKVAWKDITEKSKALDQVLGHSDLSPSFDNSSYKKALSSKITELADQSKNQSAYARKNKDAIELLSGYLNDSHNSFSAAFEHNKALNTDYQNELTVGKSLPLDIVNFAKKSLKNTIDQNLTKIDGEDLDLGNAWKGANAITAQKNKIFHEITGATGQTGISNFAKYYRGEGEFKDPSSFVKQYLPVSKEEGTQKMEQFAKMIGDSGKAKDLLKANIFDKAITSEGIKPKIFLNKFNSLSGQQKKHLFSDKQISTLDSLNKIASQYPDALSKGLYSTSGLLTKTLSSLLKRIY